MHSKNFRFEDGDEGGLLLHYGRSLGTPLWDLPYERLWQLQRAVLGQRFLREWSRYTRTFLSFFNNNNNKFIVKICFSDIDECRTIPDLCKNGLCINTLGSYRCVCNKGYKADKSGTQCVGKYSQVLSIVGKILIEWDIYIYLYRILDINECELTPRPCKYNCQNTEGSFICSCPAGFILNPDGVSCRDLDECATGNHLCQQNCINTQGSYTCGCQEGYTQDGDACHGLSRWRDVKILCSFDSFHYSNLVPIVSRHKRVWPVRNLSETGHLHQYTRQFPVYLPERVQAWSVWKILHRSERVCGWQHLRARLPGINNIIQLFKILFCLFLF